MNAAVVRQRFEASKLTDSARVEIDLRCVELISSDCVLGSAGKPASAVLMLTDDEKE